MIVARAARLPPMSTATSTPRPPNRPSRNAFWIFTGPFRRRVPRRRVTKGYRALARVLTLQRVLVDVGLGGLVGRFCVRLGGRLFGRVGGRHALLRRAGRESLGGGDRLR